MRETCGQVREVEAAIETALSRGRTRIEDVAQILYVSKSTLQRRVKPLSFTSVRRRVQLRIALKGLVRGRPVEIVAREIALSPDHLCVLVKETTGLTPVEIVRAARLVSKLRRWKAQTPPAAGTSAYRRRIREWDKSDRKLQAMLNDIGPKNPLAPWAKQLLPAVVRPDNRCRPYRDRIQAARKREKEDREHEFERLEALLDEEWADLDPEPRSPLEVAS